MTEGIIQKVIHSFHKTYVFDNEISNLLLDIQQELIEKIKQKSKLVGMNKSYFDMIIDESVIELRILIGDNEK